MSTLDCSSELPINVPRPPVPARPILATPAASDSAYLFKPSLTRPAGLLKFAIASWAITSVLPLPNAATISPSGLMRMLATDCAGDPFCVTDEVAEGPANPVSVPTPLASTMSQSKLVDAAPLAHAGLVMVTSAAGEVRRPLASNATDPLAIGNGVPAVPPLTSSPGTVIS